MEEKSFKEIAEEFLLLTAEGKARQAFNSFAGNNFKHHNVFFPGDSETIIRAMEDNAKENPDKVLDIKLIIGEGEFVAVHSHVKQNANDRGAALIHIFRFENNKIAELWDLAQPVPADTINENGMF